MSRPSGNYLAQSQLQPPVDLRAALASIEEPLSHTVRGDHIHLVEQWHDGVTIKWEPIASIPLKGSA
ncbi:hypothetical protein [Streptomyces sp. NPDC057557]|uniref:hypothetical protein n=1 Tax=Streptomyces sp. NPDC057557 TaxID=3346167 RepID=UPI0036AC869B